MVGYSSNSGTLEKPERWRLKSRKNADLCGVLDKHTPCALNESHERRIMGLELEAIEFTWKHEEELAHIIDEELTPDDVRERHLRRLPVTVVQ